MNPDPNRRRQKDAISPSRDSGLKGKNILNVIDLAIFSDILLLSPESRKGGIVYDIEDRGLWRTNLSGFLLSNI